MKWAIDANSEWREARLNSGDHNDNIHAADLSNVSKLMKTNLESSLCHFIPKVTKTKGDVPYPGKTLYQMVIAIQKYLQINHINWKLIHGSEFQDLRTVLDNVMKERCADNIGMVKKQADLISYEYEEEMWQKGVLGEDTPDKLRSTVLFLLGINLALRAVDEHYQLHRDVPEKCSQFSLETNSKGTCCLVYREDTCTVTNDGGLG